MVGSVGRVFAGIPLPGEIRAALSERLVGLDLPGRLAPSENWHITLRFLGSLDEITYDRFLHGLEPVMAARPFRIGLDGLGAFPNPRRATVVWIGIGTGAEAVAALNEQVEAAAIDAGLEPEERPFRPHLTLSRVRPPADVRRLMGETADMTWRCDRVVVYRSQPGRGGVRYVPLETFPLAR